MNEQEHSGENERLKMFEKLHQETYKKVEEDTKNRVENNPHPTGEEIVVGAFKEMIEPQVRDAVFECFRKGYTTHSSGFGGEHGEIQSLDGYFEIDEKTKEKIKNLGVSVLKGKDVGLPGYGENYTFLHFYPLNPNLKEIKEKWDKIVSVLPPKENPAMPSISGGAEEFRKKYAPNRPDIEKIILEKRLELENFHPDFQKEMQQRLEKIRKEEAQKYLLDYLKDNDFKISPEKLQFIEIENLPENYKKQFDRFDDKRLENIQIALISDFWKTSESHANKQLIIFKYEYFNNKGDRDKIHWFAHELAHCQVYLDNPKDYQKNINTPAFSDIKAEYPNDMVEKIAFTKQIVSAKEDGVSQRSMTELLRNEYTDKDFLFLNRIIEKVYK